MWIFPCPGFPGSQGLDISTDQSSSVFFFLKLDILVFFLSDSFLSLSCGFIVELTEPSNKSSNDSHW